jgi:hypothetical protein
MTEAGNDYRPISICFNLLILTKVKCVQNLRRKSADSTASYSAIASRNPPAVSSLQGSCTRI